MKTVREIRRGRARDTFTAESVYLVLNSVLDWEPMARLKQRSHGACGETETEELCGRQVYVFFVCFVFQDETSSTVLNVSKVKDTGSNQTRWERTAVADS